MGHTDIEHVIFTYIIDKHTYTYLCIERYTYTNYTDMFIYRKFLKHSSSMLKVKLSFILQEV